MEPLAATPRDRLALALAAAALFAAVAARPLAEALAPEIAATADLLRAGHSPDEGWRRHAAEAVAWSWELGLALAAVLAWPALTPWGRRPRAPRWRTELALTALVAAVPVAVAAILASLLAHGAFPVVARSAAAAEGLVVPSAWALTLSLVAAAVLYGLAWRLTRAPEEPDRSSPAARAGLEG